MSVVVPEYICYEAKIEKLNKKIDALLLVLRRMNEYLPCGICNYERINEMIEEVEDME